MTALQAFIVSCQRRVEQQLQAAIPISQNALNQAMAYSVLDAGKRIRPILVYATAEALGVKLAVVDAVACAVELIHCYSLIHDDLPAMDNDALRRGKPTCHKAFSEGVAVLAGDALQALAFEVLGQANPCLTAQQQLAMTVSLAQACGVTGMAYGQALDIAANRSTTLEQLEEIHNHKTGSLIASCIQLAVIVADCQDQPLIEQLARYGYCVGLGFQVQDDILDVEGCVSQLGKLPSADFLLDKATYPAILGLEQAKQKRDQLYQQAVAALTQVGMEQTHLAGLAEFMVKRQQ